MINKIITQLGGERFYPRPDTINTATGEVELNYNPSVTTILSQTFPTSKFLIDWQVEQGKEESARILKEASEEGIAIHQYIEDLCHGQTVDVEPMSDKQRRCVNAFILWFNKVQPQIIVNEIVVHDDELKYSGTIDLVAIVGGETYIVDLKSSNAVHDNYHAQVAAYTKAYDQKRFEAGELKAAILHLNSRTKQGYSWCEVDLDWGWKMFNLCREMFYTINTNPKPKIIEYPEKFSLNLK